MKKSLLYIIGLIAIMVVSCTDEAIIEQSGNGLRITGSLASDSRTTFVEGDGVIETHWNVDDAIGLFTENQSNLRHTAITEGESTEFVKNKHPWVSEQEDLIIEEGKTVYAIYPYQNYYDSNCTASLDRIKLLDTSSYLGGEEDFLPILYSQAQIKNGELNFQFKHLFAYLKIVVSTQLIKDIYSSTKSYYAGEYDFDIESARICINGLEDIAVGPDAYFNPKTHEITSYYGNSYTNINLYCENHIDFSSDNTYTFMLPVIPQSEGAYISMDLWFEDKNTSASVYSGYHLAKTVSKEKLQAGHVYVWAFTGEDKNEENLTLLKSFYEKTGGNEWFLNDYWMSDKSWAEWFGINGNGYSSHNIPHRPFNSPYNNIQSLDLHLNNLTGPFPEEVAGIMDQIVAQRNYPYYDKGFDLNYNNLYGPIPDKVKNHKRWNELGWNCVVQNTTGDKELDLTNSNLYVENVRVEDLFEDESTVQYLYDIFKQNKLTQITGSDFYLNEMDLDYVIRNFSDKRVNLHLDYQGKGLKTLFFLGEGTEEEINECKEGIRSIYGNVEGITWLKGKNNNNNQYRSSSYFYDSEGQLVYIAEHNPTCPWSEEGTLIEKTDQFLRSVLGEPIEHPEFTAQYYTSTDYSRNGEVVTLQQATVGKGINLTFMGEAFVDKDMEPGGFYEQTMKKAMEQFFSFEPYKSLRKRFNVYAVKVVSPNSTFVEGAQQAINLNNGICIDYAKRIPNGENSQPMVAVIYRSHTWFDRDGRSNCSMFEDGSFVAYIIENLENDGTALMHEAGGHGFGQLKDEYVESGYETVTLPEEEKTYMDEMWNQYGIGANVDWRNTESTIKWSHFLYDERYASEGLGIYEGAYTYGHGAYRPSENSMMRYNDSPFNAPSREQIYKRIMQLSEGENWKYDYEEFVKFDEKNRNAASRAVFKPLSEAERKEYIKNHRPPRFIKGTWRDAIKEKDNIVVPFR